MSDADRPLLVIHLEDARRHVAQAIAAVRAAAALDPRTARAISPTHVSLLDALQALEEVPSSPGRQALRIGAQGFHGGPCAPNGSRHSHAFPPGARSPGGPVNPSMHAGDLSP